LPLQQVRPECDSELSARASLDGLKLGARGGRVRFRTFATCEFRLSSSPAFAGAAVFAGMPRWAPLCETGKVASPLRKVPSCMGLAPSILHARSPHHARPRPRACAGTPEAVPAPACNLMIGMSVCACVCMRVRVCSPVYSCSLAFLTNGRA
jgi:hypothetical protein